MHLPTPPPPNMGKKNRMAAMTRIATSPRPIVTAGGLPPYIDRVGNSLAVSVGKLPIPNASYDADAAWVERHGGAASIFFGKLDRARKSLKSRVEIRIPVEGFMQFWSASAEFYANLKKSLAASDLFKEDLPAADVRMMDAEKEHAEWATIPAITHSGGQAQADFYSLPQGDVFMYAKHSDPRRLEITPVLRVFMTPAVLGWVMESAETVANQFSALGYVPEVPHDES